MVCSGGHQEDVAQLRLSRVLEKSDTPKEVVGKEKDRKLVTRPQAR